MAKYELPSDEDLKRLASKDPLAVVWYAYRAALRAVPLLGLTKIETVWRQGPVAHCFAVIRPLFLLSGGKDIQEYSAVASAASYAAYDAAYDAAYAAYAASASAAYAASYASYANAYAYANASAAAYDAASAAASYAASAYANANAYDAASAAAYAAAYAAASAACTQDYQVLKRYYQRRKTAFPQKKLWPKGRPDFVAEGEEALLQNLMEMGLDFVAEDLNRLFNNEPLPKERIRAYFEFNLSEAQRNDPEAIRQAILGYVVTQKEVRVLLVGPGGAGKTTLFNRLLGKDPAQHQGGATPGVFIHGDDVTFGQDRFDWLGDRNKALNGLKLKLWDFAGQTIFYGLHLAFLHENCVYVLVVDNRHEQAPDVWLAQIQDLVSGADGLRKLQVLVVTNEYENLYSKQNETRLRREFPHLLDDNSFHYFSCKDQGCRQEQCLRNGNDCKKPTGAGEACAAYQNFIDKLISKASESCVQITTDLKEKRDILKDRFDEGKILKNSKIKDLFPLEKEDEHFKALISLGILTQVFFKKSLYCMENNWLIAKVYKILNHPLILNNDGWINEDSFEALVEDQLNSDNVSFEIFRDFLQDRDLLVDVDGKFFIPDAAKADEPGNIKAWFSQNIEKKLILRFVLPFFPFGVHAGLVCDLISIKPSIINADHIWNDGFAMGNISAGIIVQYQPVKSRIELTLLGDDFDQLVNLFGMFLISKSKNKILQNMDEAICIYPVLNKKIEGDTWQNKLCARLLDRFTLEAKGADVDSKKNIGNIFNFYAPGATVNNPQTQVGEGNKQTQKIKQNCGSGFSSQEIADMASLLTLFMQSNRPKLEQDLTKFMDALVGRLREAPVKGLDEKDEGFLSKFMAHLHESVDFADSSLGCIDFFINHGEAIYNSVLSVWNSF